MPFKMRHVERGYKMPSYKTHSIHGELILPEIDKKVDIDKEDLKLYCMGPDAMVLTDYKTFDYQHSNKTRDFFINMIKLIKENKLYDNGEIMSFLYGQIDHFALDGVMHPLIYYMTEGIEKKHRIKPHGLVEMWIDDYIVQKYGKNDRAYYHKLLIKDNKLKRMIDELYKKVYEVKHKNLSYNFGAFATVIFDTIVRRNMMGIIKPIAKAINTGDFIYNKKIDRVLPYLNLSSEVWYNPETGEEYKYSFEDLWKKSMEVSLETISDVDKYIYQDKQLTNHLILDNTSFDTGFSCEKGQTLKYVKKYKR